MIPTWIIDWVPGLILDGTGLLGSWYLSNKNRVGWLVSLVAQALWTVYAIGFQQWGFLPGIILQSVINVHGYRKWKRTGAPA